VGPVVETGGTANLTTVARGCSGVGATVWYYHMAPTTMTGKRAAAYCGGGLLVLAGFSFAGGLARQSPPPSEPSVPVQTSGTANLGAEVQAQTARLKSRLAQPPAATEPVRNPFSFAAREDGRRTARTASPAAVPEPVNLPPAEPAIELVGVAEDRAPQGVVRTAIVSALSGDLWVVKEGETVAGRYKVKAIGTDAVDLIDPASGVTRRLTLRQ
jgi:hypothetical protein